MYEEKIVNTKTKLISISQFPCQWTWHLLESLVKKKCKNNSTQTSFNKNSSLRINIWWEQWSLVVGQASPQQPSQLWPSVLSIASFSRKQPEPSPFFSSQAPAQVNRVKMLEKHSQNHASSMPFTQQNILEVDFTSLEQISSWILITKFHVKVS